MGRARIVEGQPCRYGHAWNRSANWKRCLTCYPAAPPRPRRPKPPPKPASPLLLPDERRARKREQDRVRRVKFRDKVRAQRVALGLPRDVRAYKRPSLRRRLYERQCGRCALTGLPLEGARTHIDHIVPVTRGGTDDESNLQLVVVQANMAKGNGSCEEFRAWLLAAAASVRLQSLL